MPGTTTQVGRIRVIVTPDRLKAWIELTDIGDPAFQAPAADELIAALEFIGVRTNDELRDRVTAFATMIAESLAAQTEGTRPEIPKRYLVSEGTAAVEAADGHFEWHQQFQEQPEEHDEDDAVDHYTRSSILTLEAGTTIGRLTPPTDGVPGIDVYGKEIQPRKLTGEPVQLSKGLGPAPDDPNEVVTLVAGHVTVDGMHVWLEDTLRIDGDVDFETGSIDACIDVRVNGTIRPRFSVQTKRNLVVEKAVEAAEVEAQGDIVVRGGVFGRGRYGRLRAGQNIKARFCEEVRVTAGGNVRMDREMLSCLVRCEGRLLVEAGAVLGGKIYARDGVVAQVVGSVAAVHTDISIGIDPRVLAEVSRVDEDIRHQRKSTTLLQRRLQPLVANVKRLTSEQRERVVELIAKVEESERLLEELQQRRKTTMEEAQPSMQPRIVVGRLLCPGVRIGIGARETVIRERQEGPVVVELSKIHGVSQIVAVSERNGAVTVLPTTRIDLETLDDADWEDGEEGADGGQADADAADAAHKSD